MGNSKNFNNIKLLKYHYLYQTKNLINGKTYVGRHSTNNLEDGYLGSGKLLKRAISKYGRDNFRKIIMDYFDTYDELVQEEVFIVTIDYCSNDDNYNIVEGGTNPIMYGSNNPSWKGGISSHSNYRKKGKYDFSGDNNPRYGYVYTKEEKMRMLMSQTTRRSLFFKGVYYNSLRECMRSIGRSRDYIKRICASPVHKDSYYIK